MAASLVHLSQIIESFLGPNKCLKFITEGDEVDSVSCPADYLSLLPYQNSLSQFINSAVQTHHEKFTNGTGTLITYTHFFYKAMAESTKRGADAIETSKKLKLEVEECIKFLKTKTSPLIKTFHTIQKSIMKQRNNTFNAKPSVHRILNASRHFRMDITDEEDHITIKNVLMEKIKKIIDPVIHGFREKEISSLIIEAWINQIMQRSYKDNYEAFHLDVSNIHLLPIIGNSQSSRVVPGILIPTTRLNDVYFPHSQHWRALLIAGSLKFNYTHRGYNESIKTKQVLRIEDFLSPVSHAEDWNKNVLQTLNRMKVNLVLLQGSADEKLLDDCFSAEILVIENVNEKLLYSFASSFGIQIENYLDNCDETNIISNLSVERWCLNQTQDNYIMLSSPSLIQTLVICSSCTPLASANEHCTKHLMHRISACLTESIPGGGEVEEDCINWLRSNEKSESILIDIFEQYRQTLEANLSLTDKRKTLDAFNPKIEAWKSALQIATTNFFTDSIVLVGDQNEIWKQVKTCKYNFVGNL